MALGKSLRELWDSMDGVEYAEWRDFWTRFPFGPLRGDLQAAGIIRHLEAGRGIEPGEIDEYIIKFSRPVPLTSDKIMRWVLKSGGYVVGSEQDPNVKRSVREDEPDRGG